MNQQPVPALNSIFKAVRSAGVTSTYIKNCVLPDWWEPEVASTPAGLAETVGYISNHLGLKASALLKPEPEVVFACKGTPKYKTGAGKVATDLALATTVAAQALRIALLGAAEYKGLPDDAAFLRENMLSDEHYGVDLEDLLDECWDRGIPVLHICTFPPKAKKMDAMAVSVNGRPAIALCSNRKSPSYAAFNLAHEIGHIAKGHLAATESLVDEKIRHDDTDDEELQANDFALELLTGSSDTTFVSNRGKWLSGAELAAGAGNAARQFKVAPGIIALNYAWNAKGEKQFAAANAALSVIENSKKSAKELVLQKLLRNLRWEDIPEESSAWLKRLCGLPLD